MLMHRPAYKDLDLDPASRAYALRDMFWRGEQNSYRLAKVLVGSGEPTLVGKAKDFATVLAATPVAIQPLDRLAGVTIVEPAPGSTIDLGNYDGHYTPGHANIIRLGYTGIRDRAKEKLAAETDPAKRDFLEATIISYEAAIRFAARHARYAHEMADQTKDPTRAAELWQLAEACQELTEGPPTSFLAGLQMLWFTFMFGGRGSIGRFDQWLYPLYRHDLESGALTPLDAQELIENYFVKLNYFAASDDLMQNITREQIAPVLDDVHDAERPYVAIHNDSLRNIVLGGQTPAGDDASNELSEMCLIAGGRLMLPEPKLNVRFFDGSPPELLELSCRLTCKGLSNPAYFNDNVAIPGLLQLGIPLEDARDYCNDGCSEIILGGKSTIRFKNFDTLPLLNETVQQAAQSGYSSFEEVMADFEARLAAFIPDDKDGGKADVTFPYFAASLDDCLEAASIDGVRYSIWGSIPSQMGNVADGLAAIKKFIFADQSMSWPELIQALEKNFDGQEPLRQKILNRAPKYGNDNDEVDAILKEIAENFCDTLHEKAHNELGPGGKMAPGFMSFAVHNRRFLPATPDGRKQEENVASSFSPGLGRDKLGPTAVLKSVSKVDLSKAGHGSVLDIAFHPSALRGEAGLQKFMAFVKTFLQLPATTTLQVNMVDRETLIAARANPTDPRYRTLLVRVWGFSTVFVTLDPAMQEHVIERTKHTF
ncbi:MAG: hypothetical protein KDE59_02030 [Anaerolineales bacterium]|nr:hypothetical protein [Anaerolineales bacterium]